MTLDWWISVAGSILSVSLAIFNFSLIITGVATMVASRRHNRMTLKAIMDAQTVVSEEGDVTVVSFRTGRPGTYLLHDTQTGQVWGWHDAAQGWVDTGRRAMKQS